METSKVLRIVYGLILVLSISYTGYLKKELGDAQDGIDDLYSKVEDLESKIEDLEDAPKDISANTSSSSDNWYYEEKIKLLEQELDFDKTRTLKQEVFYDMIKGSEFEGYIVSNSYQDPSRPKLSKVVVSVSGTENVIDFLQHLYEKYRWLYIESNF